MIRIGSIEAPGDQATPLSESSYDDTATHIYVPRPRRASETW